MSDQMSVLEPKFLDVGEGAAARQIAMLIRPAKANTDLPALIWLSGYRSDMSGSKAVEIDRLAEELGAACIRLDYSGHGLSGGAFTDGTISRWLEEALGKTLPSKLIKCDPVYPVFRTHQPLPVGVANP